MSDNRNNAKLVVAETVDAASMQKKPWVKPELVVLKIWDTELNLGSGLDGGPGGNNHS